MFACLNKQVKVKSPLGHEFKHGGERGKHQHQTVRGVYSTAPAMAGFYLDFYVQSPWFAVSFRCDSPWSSENRGAFCAAPWSLFTTLRFGHGCVPTVSHIMCIRAWLMEMEGVVMSCKYGQFWSQHWWTAALFLQAGYLLAPLNPRLIQKPVDRIFPPQWPHWFSYPLFFPSK